MKRGDVKDLEKEKRSGRIITLTVNGEERPVTVEDRDTLLDVLRNKLSLTGAKEGCGTGECGSCTVLLDGQPVLACLTLAVGAVGKKITTIEGIDGTQPDFMQLQRIKISGKDSFFAVKLRLKLGKREG